ncbi:hypothetical protein [Ferrimonas balearica]|nr:hypothetical protein [Ferrimonas balearica]
MAEVNRKQEQAEAPSDWRDGQLGQQLVDLLEEAYQDPDNSESQG